MQGTTKLIIEFSPLFNDKLSKLPLEIIAAFHHTLELLRDNLTHAYLRRHHLKEKYQEYESIDVTDDYRAIFKEIKSESMTIIKFHTIGTHEELYGKL